MPYGDETCTRRTWTSPGHSPSDADRPCNTPRASCRGATAAPPQRADDRPRPAPGGTPKPPHAPTDGLNLVLDSTSPHQPATTHHNPDATTAGPWGRHRKTNPEYRRLNDRRQRARKRGDRAAAWELLKQMRKVPCGDPTDAEYRRLRYCRYADDHLLGFTGPKAEAEAIKDQLAAFLRDELALELSAEKTLVTHARTRAARFLGYEITVRHDDSKITGGRRMLNGTIALRVPLTVVRAKCAPYRRRGKPWLRPALTNLSDYDIVRVYA